MKRSIAFMALMVVFLAPDAGAQGLRPDPVFDLRLLADRNPLVAGEELNLAVELTIDMGWHVNSDEPEDEFSMPTTVEWQLPEGWSSPDVQYPDGEMLSFEFSDDPIEVWEGRVVIFGAATVPSSASGEVELSVKLTAQACDDAKCLPPVPVTATMRSVVVAAGSNSQLTNEEIFEPFRRGGTGHPTAADDAGLAGKSLPLLILTVFIAGLALNLTPCVYPIIPITVGFFAQQAKEGKGGSFGLALVYVLGMSVTYSTLGVIAALTGRLFGAALQNPIVVGVIVAVMLALAASMFGLWELRVPSWAMRASGGRGGLFGAWLMGLLVGFVAAPCIGPFVLGLLTYVGQQGSPLLGFVLFFTLAMGLGLPYLVLGTFTGAVNKMPASGAWMIGVRKVFGVLLIGMAVYFARPFLPGVASAWAMGLVLLLGGLYLLIIDRTGHEQPTIDRFMRLVSVVLVVVGVSQLPWFKAGIEDHLAWTEFDANQAAAAIESGTPVIIDFYADWCAPCRELDERTFADPRVASVLADFARFKVDQTTSNPIGDEAVGRYEVMGMPTVIVFRDGVEAFRITGFEGPDRFLDRLQQ